MEDLLDNDDEHLWGATLPHTIRIADDITVAQREQVRRIRVSDTRRLAVVVEDTGSGDFNVVRFRLSLVEAFSSNSCLEDVSIHSSFLSKLCPSVQRNLFSSLMAIPSLKELALGGGNGGQDPGGSLRIESFLVASHDPACSLTALCLRDFQVNNQTLLDQLGTFLRYHVQSLETLVLEKVLIPGHAPAVLFDPVALAAVSIRDLRHFRIRCIPCFAGPSHLGTATLVHLLRYKNIRRDGFALTLDGLLLRDADCYAISEVLSTRGQSDVDLLCLSSNPSIGENGHASLLGIFNRIASLNISVDEEQWNSKFNLVQQMNRLGRLRYLEGGVFASKKKWVDWMINLARLGPEEATGHPSDEWILSAIQFTLRERSDYIQR